MAKSKYDLPDSECTITRDDLEKADRDTQIDVMRTWFFQNYEDPAERTPYDSGEGGYIWIWGGPHEAQDVLETEFFEIIPEELIHELSKELDEICWEWAPTESPDDYDDYYVDDITNKINCAKPQFYRLVEQALYIRK